MSNRNWTMAVSIALGLVAGTWGIQRADAQVPGFKRVELQKHDLSTPGREALVARGEFQPGAAAPKHTHPGEEIGFILEGEVTVEIEGQPAKTLKAGDTFFIPAGTVHSAKNTGKAQALVLSTYVVEKGKPLATPVK
jgi:quercetin dioxygenase-like cupin family protein